MNTIRSGKRQGLHPFRLATLLAIPAVMLSLAACDSDPTGIDDEDDDHVDAARVELHTRGAAGALRAVWTDGEGWRDGNGASITELPNPVDVEGEGLLPLRAGGQQASLTVRFFEPDGSEVEMSTLSRDDVTRERQCSEYEVRYYPLDDNTNVLAWPNIRHPQSTNGPFQFARRANDELVGIYHCDHIHLYPEAEGTADIEFRLWHIDHSDMETDPLRVRVEAGDPPAAPARIEVETRGAARAMLGVWTAGEGWTDGDGNTISRIETPRDVEGEGLVPLVAGGSNASLTVRYFLEGGEQADIRTLSRDDVTRERQCTDLQARYSVVGDETDVIAWPPVRHPDSGNGETQFARLADDSLVGIFHCDHIHFYPEAEGEVEVRFTIGSQDTTEAQSDPITIVVEEAVAPARIEVETRGAARALLGVWTEVDGWTDADGNAITRIDTPRDVEGEGLVPLVAGGNNASLTVRYFFEGGEEADIRTLGRDDDTRERQCTDLQARYTVEDDDTEVIGWPPVAHPDSPGGETQFARLADDSLVGIFHCDHIHFYPEAAGEAEVRFTIGSQESTLVSSDPIVIPVND